MHLYYFFAIIYTNLIDQKYSRFLGVKKGASKTKMLLNRIIINNRYTDYILAKTAIGEGIAY
jgi:hypothetical protein